MTRLDRYDSLFQYYQPTHVRWQLLKKQAIAESNMNPRAKSPVGAMGLTQFMPATWAEVMPTLSDPYNPEDSIKAQATYMNQLMTMFADDERKAIAAYNCGPGRVRKLVAEYGVGWERGLPAETKGYLARIFDSPPPQKA